MPSRSSHDDRGRREIEVGVGTCGAKLGVGAHYETVRGGWDGLVVPLSGTATGDVPSGGAWANHLAAEREGTADVARFQATIELAQAEELRRWKDVFRPPRPTPFGMSGAELAQLRRETAELRQENAHLRGSDVLLQSVWSWVKDPAEQ